MKSTKGISISDVQLIQCSASEVNQLCKGLPKGTVKQINKRRWTLKNKTMEQVQENADYKLLNNCN